MSGQFGRIDSIRTTPTEDCALDWELEATVVYEDGTITNFVSNVYDLLLLQSSDVKKCVDGIHHISPGRTEGYIRHIGAFCRESLLNGDLDAGWFTYFYINMVDAAMYAMHQDTQSVVELVDGFFPEKYKDRFYELDFENIILFAAVCSKMEYKKCETYDDLKALLLETFVTHAIPEQFMQDFRNYIKRS